MDFCWTSTFCLINVVFVLKPAFGSFCLSLHNKNHYYQSWTYKAKLTDYWTPHRGNWKCWAACDSPQMNEMRQNSWEVSISVRVGMHGGMYLACFLRLRMTSESLLGSQMIILWSLREMKQKNTCAMTKYLCFVCVSSLMQPSSFSCFYFCIIDKKKKHFLKVIKSQIWDCGRTETWGSVNKQEVDSVGEAWEEWVGSHSSISGKVWNAFGVRACSEECLGWYCDIPLLGLWLQ